jgi:signal transduction histidine kinase
MAALRVSSNFKYVLIVFLALIGIGSLWYTRHLAGRLRETERQSVNLWAKAIEFTSTEQYVETRRELDWFRNDIEAQNLLSPVRKTDYLGIIDRVETDLANASLDFVTAEILLNNAQEIPTVITDMDGGVVLTRNVDSLTLANGWRTSGLFGRDSIIIRLDPSDTTRVQILYYGESELVRMLQYFPMIQFGLVMLVFGLAYMSWSSIRRNEQSSVWIGMSKEAAHQLGTPLSGLMGWSEVLRETSDAPEIQQISVELDKDIDRLKIIADRFNKIGSKPELTVQRIDPVLDHVCDYLARRLPQIGRGVKLHRKLESGSSAALNADLFQWAVENVLKNAIDAIEDLHQGAFVSIYSYKNGNQIWIDIEDSGKGMEKRVYKKIFEPGFSTKKRGWGLGLTLTKRIVEEYHNGKVYVVRSEPGAGTTMRMVVPVQG